jgi:hypothetical protein
MMQINLELLTRINMDIKSIPQKTLGGIELIDTTQPSNTPTIRRTSTCYILELTEHCLKYFDMILNINCATLNKQDHLFCH